MRLDANGDVQQRIIKTPLVIYLRVEIVHDGAAACASKTHHTLMEEEDARTVN